MNYEIEPYKSTYPLAYYDIGTVYSFYGRRESTWDTAPEVYVKQYAHLLNKLEDEEKSNVIKAVRVREENFTSLIRYYGVVVEKASGSYDSIKVMVLSEIYGRRIYLIRSYVVGRMSTEAITTDGKDLMAVSAKADVDISDNIFDNISYITTKVSSGITRANKSSTDSSVTGVTRASNTMSDQPKGVTGITRTHKESAEISHAASDVPTVTGITRVDSVTGITRAGNSVSGITRAKK